MEKEKLRLDKYLWAIRLFKTRTAASTACDKGRVKMNGEAIKASRVVKVEDSYEVKTDEKKMGNQGNRFATQKSSIQ